MSTGAGSSTVVLERSSKDGILSSSLSAGLFEPTVLLREGEVIEDIRRMSLEARDSFFSSGEDADVSLGDLERKYPSFLDDTDSLLSERGIVPAAGLAELIEETDILRGSIWFGVASGVGSRDAGSSGVPCSTVNGLACRLRVRGSVPALKSFAGALGSRIMRAVTETEFVGCSALVLALESGRLRLAVREKGSGAYDECRDNDASELPVPYDTDARLRTAPKEAAVGVDKFGGVAAPSRLPENCSNALMRLEIPEETLIFLATKTGLVGSSACENGLETDLAVAKAGALAY